MRCYNAQAIGRLIAASAPAFSALLRNIARLANDDGEVAETAERQIGIPASVVREVISAGAGTRGAEGNRPHAGRRALADPVALSPAGPA